MFLKPTHYTSRSIQPPGTAPGQQDGMHTVNQIAGMQQIGLPRARCRAAHVHATNRPFAGDDHCTAGRAARISEMANFDADDVCD